VQARLTAAKPAQSSAQPPAQREVGDA
jgi:hypothetical protein